MTREEYMRKDLELRAEAIRADEEALSLVPVNEEEEEPEEDLSLLPGGNCSPFQCNKSHTISRVEKEDLFAFGLFCLWLLSPPLFTLCCVFWSLHCRPWSEAVADLWW